MATLQLDPSSTALVFIDLQNGILGMPFAPHTPDQLLDHANTLAAGFRAESATVIFVRVDLASLRHPEVDIPTTDPTAPPPPALASELSSELHLEPTDVLITKKQWGAFHNTDLDQQLWRRGIRTIVLGGITTNFGVESTARAAFDLGYNLIFAKEAMTSVDPDAHHFATNGVFPYMGKVRSTAEILEALKG